jgi:hypothetical protein
MKFKYTKWHKYPFTADQKTARRMWTTASEYYFELVDALKTSPDGRRTRKQFHEKLDKVLDAIERNRTGAIELFPEVQQSFTIAETTLV